MAESRTPDAAQVTSLFERSRGGAWGLSRARFAAALEASLQHAYNDASPGRSAISGYLDGLHVEDLALAVACAEGHAPAWDHLVAEHRAGLLRAADALDATGGAREIAESLFAELFGLTEREGKRQSLLRYFHGRSRLSTWLRAVLSQRYIDRYRAARRTESLAEDDSTAAVASAVPAIDPARQKYESAMRTAVTATIAALPARDRLRLACYHGDGMTLAAIGRMLKEHEATVSRHLARTRREIRDAVEARLTSDFGMDRAAINECFRAVTEDAGAMDISELLGSKPDSALGKNPLPDRSST